jgi:hypothetical protein
MSRNHLSLVKKPSGHPVDPSGETKNIRVAYQPGITICEHLIERSDVHRCIRFDQQIEVYFTEEEYLLFGMLLDYYMQKKHEVSYADIATSVFACAFDDELLLVIRKRMSSLRRKIARLDLDVMNIPQRGYELRSLRDVVWPYRRGHRARMSRQ